MAMCKVQKNKAYYKRIQTKYRRRREGKTDYFARRKMVTQDKNKYNTPKYRLVVRITNKRIITQIVYSTILGDKVLTQATSPELEKYGCAVGFTNYAAAYCTGLLIARRALNKLGMDEAITGVEECTAEEFHVEEEDIESEKRPFKAILDVGPIRTVMGSRVFGVLKGAVDGGLHVPHKVRKFTGYSEPEERGMDYTYDAGAHLERIMGLHVQEYVEMLQEEDQERYKVQFSKIIAEGIEADGIEDMYKETHAAIRESPAYVIPEKKKIINVRTGNKVTPDDGSETYVRKVKMSYKQRKDTVKQKIQSAQARMAGAIADDDEEEE